MATTVTETKGDAMRSGDIRRLERLEGRHRAAQAQRGGAAAMTEAGLDAWTRDFVARTREWADAAWRPFLDAMLALPSSPDRLVFGRAAHFFVLLVGASAQGDEAQAVKYRGLLDGRLREEYPPIWRLYPNRIADDPLAPPGTERR